MVKPYDGEAGTRFTDRDTYIFKVLEASKELLTASKFHKSARSRIRQALRHIIVYWYDHADRHSGDPSHFHSTSARIRRQSGSSSSGCTYDHVVPLSLVVDQLLERDWSEASQIRAFLNAFYRTCWITVEEDALLNSRGLRDEDRHSKSNI